MKDITFIQTENYEIYTLTMLISFVCIFVACIVNNIFGSAFSGFISGFFFMYSFEEKKQVGDK